MSYTPSLTLMKLSTLPLRIGSHLVKQAWNDISSLGKHLSSLTTSYYLPVLLEIQRLRLLSGLLPSAFCIVIWFWDIDYVHTGWRLPWGELEIVSWVRGKQSESESRTFQKKLSIPTFQKTNTNVGFARCTVTYHR